MATELTQDIAATEAELSQAEASALTATPAELGTVGGTIAGLRARLAGLQRRHADATAAAQAAEAERQAEAAKADRAHALADVAHRQRELGQAFDDWNGDLLAAEAHVAGLWGRFEELQAKARQLSEDAAALGLNGAKAPHKTPERVRDIQRGRSLYLRWRPAQVRGIH